MLFSIAFDGLWAGSSALGTDSFPAGTIFFPLLGIGLSGPEGGGSPLGLQTRPGAMSLSGERA
jgi:hypothetical protein